VPLAGLILHASRCGSTVLLAALGTCPGVVPVDEPPELDVALRVARAGGGTSQLRDVLSALESQGDQVVVKTDAWHALELPRLLAAAPGVPWLFVYRDPLEILVSHRRQPGSHTVPGVLSDVWFGPPPEESALTPYAARVIRTIFDSVVPHARAENLVDYAEIPGALPRVGAHFGLPAPDPHQLDGVLAWHAKRPYEAFVDDRADKQAAADLSLRAIVDTELTPSYAALRALRHRAVA
jgi:hypothetical protein